MERKAILLCLLVVLLTESSTGFFRVKLIRRGTRRKCPDGVFRVLAHRRCKRPTPIAMMPVTAKPPTKAGTRPVVLLKPVALHSSGLPYCKRSRDVNAILRPTTGRTKRAVSWPYECRYASIVSYLGNYQFIWPIYDCCTKCSFPTFTNCVADSTTKKSPNWVCPSKGLHCIVDCVNKHNPGNTIGVPRPRPVPGRPGPLGGKPPPPVKPALGKCEKLEKENGKNCVRQLCVPLNFKP